MSQRFKRNRCLHLQPLESRNLLAADVSVEFAWPILISTPMPRRLTKRTKAKRRLQFQQLETRQMLAADVSVELRELETPEATRLGFDRSFDDGSSAVYELTVRNRGPEVAEQARVQHDANLANLRWELKETTSIPSNVEVQLPTNFYAFATPVGDFNGDGFDDFAIGGIGQRNSRSEVIIVFGAEDRLTPGFNGLDEANVYTIKGRRTTRTSEFGRTVAAAGDINNDGLSDIVIGGGFGRNEEEELYVVFGSADAKPGEDQFVVGIRGTNGFRFTVPDGSQRLGTKHGAAGDVNRDGIDDLFVTTSKDTYVIYGGQNFENVVTPNDFDDINGFRMPGHNVVAIGDVNGDQFDDFAIRGGILLGRGNIPSDILTGELRPSVEFLESIQASGDFDGDGINDLILRGADRISLLFGGDHLIEGAKVDDSNPALATFFSSATADTRQIVVSVQDNNDDGLADITLSYRENQSQSIDVYYGNRDRITTPVNLLAGGEYSNGWSIGDINADGFGDQLIQGCCRETRYSIIYGPPLIADFAGTIPENGNGPIDFTTDLAPGNEFTFRLAGRVDGQDEIGFQASVASDSSDPNPDNNAALFIANVDRRDGLTTNLIGPVGPFAPGQRVNYTIHVANEGTLARDVSISSPVTSILSDASWEQQVGTFAPTTPLSAGYWGETTSSLDGTDGYVVEGVSLPGNRGPSSQSVGVSTSGGGDLNGDGIDDVAVGRQGEVWVRFGSASLPLGRLSREDWPTSEGMLITGIPHDLFASRVSFVDDINGDQIDDLLIAAAPINETVRRQPVGYVVFGDSELPAVLDVSNLNGGSGFQLLGIPAREDGFLDGEAGNVAIGPAGDLNRDGLGDFWVSTIDHIFVIFGDEELSITPAFDLNNINGANGFRIQQNRDANHGAIPVAGQGDFNGDGHDDLAIGDGRNARILTELEIGEDGVLKLPKDDTLRTNVDQNAFVHSLDISGDLNADGIDDLAIGIRETRQTLAYVVYGSQDTTRNIKLTSQDRETGFRITETGRSGGTLRFVGDINADGIEDLAIHSSAVPIPFDRFDEVEPDLHVIFGTENQDSIVDVSALNGINGSTWKSTVGSREGSISRAGDHNNDGVDDVIFGVSSYINGGILTIAGDGEAYVLFGREPELAQGTGDIRHVVDIPAGHAVTYEIAGTVREPADELGITTTAYLEADLQVSSPEPQRVLPGQLIEYQFTVENDALDRAVDVRVQDSLSNVLEDVHEQTFVRSKFS